MTHFKVGKIVAAAVCFLTMNMASAEELGTLEVSPVEKSAGSFKSMGEARIENPEELLPGGDSFLSWDPTGENPAYTTPECARTHLVRALRSTSHPRFQADAVKEYLRRCESQINVPIDSIPELIRYSFLGHSVHANPHIRRVTIRLPQGRVVSGYLGMKPGARARPLVIVQCGLFCDAADSTTHRNFVAHLYDESPFHVLTVASVTGQTFQKANRIPALGGFDEGRQLYQIARLFRSSQSEFASVVSGVHVIGVSLGGHAALYASLYDSLNGATLIDSVIAVCPVVHLQNSVRDIFANTVIGFLTTEMTRSHLLDIVEHVPLLKEELDTRRPLTRKEMFEGLSRAASRYYLQMTSEMPWDLKPFSGLTIGNRETWWTVNNAVSFASFIRRPTLVLASRNDSIVSVARNARLLDGAASSNPNLNILTFERGDHCGLSAANGWANVSALLREYILSHAPDGRDFQIADQRRIDDILRGLKWPRKLELRNRERIAGYRWDIKKGSDRAVLKLPIFSPNRKRSDETPCFLSPYHQAPMECYRHFEVAIPLTRLPAGIGQIPRNDYEVNVLRRWMNTRFTVTDEKGAELEGSSGLPTTVGVD